MIFTPSARNLHNSDRLIGNSPQENGHAPNVLDLMEELAL